VIHQKNGIKGMYKMKQVVAVIGVLATIIFANASAEEIFSVEVLLGSANQTLNDNSYITVNDTSLGIRIGQKMTDFVTFSLAYKEYGEPNQFSADRQSVFHSYRTSTFIPSIKVAHDITEKLSIYGRIGLSFWRWKLINTDTTTRISDKGGDPHYGVGLTLRSSENVFIGAEYNFTNMAVNNNGDTVDYEIKDFVLSAGYVF